MIRNLNYGVNEIFTRTITESREFGKPNQDGGYDIYVQVNCVIYANESINFTMQVTNHVEFENFKDLIQPQINEFVNSMKDLAIQQGVPMVVI